MQMAADKGELQKESSTLRSKLVAEKQHAAVLQVMLIASYMSVWVLHKVLLCTLRPSGCFDSQSQTSLAEPGFQTAASVEQCVVLLTSSAMWSFSEFAVQPAPCSMKTSCVPTTS